MSAGAKAKRAKPKPAARQCPRENFHRPGVYCKTCDRIPVKA